MTQAIVCSQSTVVSEEEICSRVELKLAQSGDVQSPPINRLGVGVAIKLEPAQHLHQGTDHLQQPHTRIGGRG